MKLKNIFLIVTIFIASGCSSQYSKTPAFSQITPALEEEYNQFLSPGDGSITGQAFATQPDGGTVKAAGRIVTLDPKTTLGHEWWVRAGQTWAHRTVTPPSTNFMKARRTTVADAEGRFKFNNLPAGKYYLRTEITWYKSDFNIQGGLICKEIEILSGKATEIVITR